MVAVGLVLLRMPSTWPLLGTSLIFLGVVSTLAALYVKPPHVRAWRIGAGGEERVGELLAPLEAEGFRILHDRRRPGGRDNIDHIVIGPPGVVVVETKRYAGSVRVRGRELLLKGRRHTEFVEQVRRQVDSLQESLGVTGVAGIICVVDGEFPLFGSRSVAGIELVSQRSLAKTLRSMPVALGADEIDRLARQADQGLRPAR